MNLIYICVFYQKNYIDLLNLLLKSILVKSNIDENTNILIITSPEFKLLIEKVVSYCKIPLEYYILNYNTLFEAGCARLNIFNYDKINLYEKILYLDTDILINSNINVLFNLNTNPTKLYALEEGNIGHEYWGSQFFDFSKFNINQQAFTSGVLYFHNNNVIKLLFQDIQNHIQKYIYVDKNKIPDTLDQPFIVYNAIIQNKYDNQLMKSYVENNPTFINNTKIIYHFPGKPGFYSSKYDKMSVVWKSINKITPVLFQTNKIPNDDYVLNMINNKLDNSWKYEFYNDADVIDFFEKNPIKDLPDIISKYKAISKGAHKADLFRYYYLYLKGGFFMDSDAMIYENISSIVKKYDFVSVYSTINPGAIFQGILAAAPYNEIIKNALWHAYNTPPEILEIEFNYHYFCKTLFDIIKYDKNNYRIKLYKELRDNDIFDKILNDNNNIIFKHFWKNKIILQSEESEESEESKESKESKESEESEEKYVDIKKDRNLKFNINPRNPSNKLINKKFPISLKYTNSRMNYEIMKLSK
jgi:mannosyltransferase OCH1-like enzyme